MTTDPYPKIETSELANRLRSSEIQTIDIRPTTAYNGWQFGLEERTGHIKGARSLPFKWLQYIDWLEIVQNKSISPGQPVVIYGRDREKTEAVVDKFEKAGYKNVKLYPYFETEWSSNSELPMNHLPRFEHLVYPGWVKELIETGDPPLYKNDKYVICHAYYRDRSAYEKGHIPEAIPLNTNDLEDPATWNRRSPEEIESALLERGITADTTVILYGRFDNPAPDEDFPGSSAGQLGALRCAFLMVYAGVKDVRILNGGLQAWKDAGFEQTDAEIEPEPETEFGAPLPLRPEIAVDTEQARQILAQPDKNLISVRSRGEFLGEKSGYNYIDKKGRIPGAVFGNCGSDAYHMENYRNLDHTTREFSEIEAMWAEAGITPDKHNSFYCGTGWRASEAFFNAWLLEWSDISVYDGGWYEWSRDEDNPTARGKPRS